MCQLVLWVIINVSKFNSFTEKALFMKNIFKKNVWWSRMVVLGQTPLTQNNPDPLLSMFSQNPHE